MISRSNNRRQLAYQPFINIGNVHPNVTIKNESRVEKINYKENRFIEQASTVKIESIEYIKLQDIISSISKISKIHVRKPPKNPKTHYRSNRNSVFLYSNYNNNGLLHSNVTSIYNNSCRIYHTSASRQLFKKSPDTSIKGSTYESKNEVKKTQYKKIETKAPEPLSPFRKGETKSSYLNVPSKIKTLQTKVSTHVSKLPEYGVTIGHKSIKISKALGYALLHPIETKDKSKLFLVKHVVKPYRLIKADVRLVKSIYAARKKRPNKEFTAIEKRRLIAIFSDAVRFVPYIFFILVPALELLLPVYLAVFPGAKPGWFMSPQDANKKLQTKLEYRLEIAKFLKDTVELYGKRQEKKEGTNLSNLSKRIMGGGDLTAETLLPYVDLFKTKHMSLDNWNKDSLRSICALLSFPAIINNAPDFMLKQSIEWRMATLRNEDEKFHKNGFAEISDKDLSMANIVRGGRGYGLTRQKLEKSIKLWSDMNYVHELPIPLILYTKAVYILPNTEPRISEELKLKKEQPKIITEEQKLAAKISEDRLKQDLNFQALNEISLTKKNLIELEKSLDKVYQIVILMDNSATIEQLHKSSNSTSERANKMSKILEKYSTKTESTAINLESNNEIYEFVIEKFGTNESKGYLPTDVFSYVLNRSIPEEDASLNSSVVIKLMRALNPEMSQKGVHVDCSRQAIKTLISEKVNKRNMDDDKVCTLKDVAVTVLSHR